MMWEIHMYFILFWCCAYFLSSGLGFHQQEGTENGVFWKLRILLSCCLPFLIEAEEKDKYIKNLSKKKKCFWTMCSLLRWEGERGMSPSPWNISLSLKTLKKGCNFNFALVILFAVARASILGRFQITFEKFRALFLSVTLLHTSLGLVPISAIHRFGRFQPGFLMCCPSCDFSQLVWISQTGYGKRVFLQFSYFVTYF